jgi:type I restriction enzyme, S subunit
MKYQAYPDYKDSGVEWLGVVPNSWISTRLKFEALINMGQSPNSDDCNQDGFGLPFLQGNAEFGDRSPSPKQYCDIPRKIATEGQLLFSVRAPVGALNIADQKYGIGRGLCAIASNETIASDFLWWLIPVVKSELNSVSTGSTFEAVSAEQVENVVFFRPSIFEQEKIANFLDHETAKIDTLIEKQQQLIKLLKEKRQAVISHAVTKGLNPNAPMRDSGVEWLGEVPKHWNSMQIRRIISRMEQGKSPECDNKVAEFDEWGVLKTSCVNKGIYNSEANKALPDNIKPFPQYEVKEGDILMSRASGSINLIGSVAYVYKTRPKILLSDKIFRLYLDSSMSKIFFCYLMYSTYMRANIERAISGAEGMANNITKGAVIGFVFALPPLDEQQFIVDFIFKRLDKFRRLIQKAEVAINLMQERRTALISAAVTGKIDVRNWQAPEPLPSNNEISKEEAA